MSLGELIATIEGAATVEELRTRFARIVQDFGFAGFGFIDAAAASRGRRPNFVGAIDAQWMEDYRRNDFAFVDPCIRLARRTNTPFAWSEVPLPERQPRQRIGAVKAMEAAREYGFRDGLVVPFHFRDRDGLYYSACSVFYWKDRKDAFDKVLRAKRFDLHYLMLYWMQRALDLIAVERRGEPPPLRAAAMPEPVSLSDQERDVLAHASRGLTMSETAEAMILSEHTVDTHMRRAMVKLNARNKAHAAVLAVYLGLIDPA